MEKVKLPRKVAEAVVYLKQEDFTDNDLIRVGTGDKERAYEAEDIIHEWCGKGNLIRFVGALVNGYEVEEEPITVTITPEQQDAVRDFISEIKRQRDNAINEDQMKVMMAKLFGVIETIDLLKIKIPGVNAE